jgi:UDP-glucose 4-epimerase
MAEHDDVQPLRVALLGGCGFVGLNIAEALLRQGHDVLCLDRNPLPAAARAAFAGLPGRLRVEAFDVTQPGALEPGTDALVLGAAITAGTARETAEPESILAVNLGALPGLLRAARQAGVKRVLNLSSASAYGAGPGEAPVAETDPARPAQLYGITKLASEQVGARLATLWGLDFISVRLSAVFGPWEYATGLRDTLSPPFQVMRAAARGTPALLPRPGLRDWVYAPDVAEAVALLLRARRPGHDLYNITHSGRWPLLARGGALAQVPRPGFTCRLAAAGEAATIDLHGPADRAALDPARLAEEFGWRARFGLAESAAHFESWWLAHGPALMETA